MKIVSKNISNLKSPREIKKVKINLYCKNEVIVNPFE